MAAFPNPFSLPGLSRRRPGANGPALARLGSRYNVGWGPGFPMPYGGTGEAGGGLAPRPFLREAQVDTQEAWTAATASVIEMMQTSGWMAGAVKSARGQIMFENGLRPNLKPWAGMISSDAKLQASWSRDTEGRFMAWASNPWNIDIGGRHNLGALCDQAVNQIFATGEIVATLPMVEPRSSPHELKVNLLPSQRLSQYNGTNTIQGVTMDPRTGCPTAYNFIKYNLASGTNEPEVVQARDAMGRQSVVHVFDNAPGTVRGITPFAPALRVMRQSDQLGNAQLMLSLLQNIFAATVESPLPSAEILMALMGAEEQDAEEREDMYKRMATIGDTGQHVVAGSFMDLLKARSQWYASTNIDLGRFAKIAHLFPGEKLTFTRPNNPTADYLNFQKFLYYECARAMGVTSFMFTGIFEGYTYTTAKMAIDENWPMTLWRRSQVARFVQAIFMAWLEEDIALGNTKLPGGIAQFHAARDYIARCDWIGPPKPTADDLKTAKAMQVERAEGWTSSAQIASRYGNDWSEEADDQAEFEEYRRDKNLSPLPNIGGGGNGAGSAAVAGGDGPGTQQDREARLVGAMVRGDDSAVESILMESEDERRNFVWFADRAAADWRYRRAA